MKSKPKKVIKTSTGFGSVTSFASSTHSKLNEIGYELSAKRVISFGKTPSYKLVLTLLLLFQFDRVQPTVCDNCIHAKFCCATYVNT